MLKFCPHCGKKSFESNDSVRFFCTACGFTFFFDVAVSAALIIVCKKKVLLVQRDRNPQKGKWALPGGFVNRNEPLEEACIRECKEEINFDAKKISYLGSFPNRYLFENVEYHICDTFFWTKLKNESELENLNANDGEVSKMKLVNLAEIDYDEIAFPSIAFALKKANSIFNQM